MTREEFNNNSYLVNNNALYNKHTEHISTTEPLYLDGMGGSDNIVHKKSANDGGDTPEPQTLWILDYGGDGFIFGQYQDGKLFIEGPSEDKMYIADPHGRILGFENFYPEYEPLFVDQFEQYFEDIESVQILATGHEINYVVPNWAEYKLLN